MIGASLAIRLAACMIAVIAAIVGLLTVQTQLTYQRADRDHAEIVYRHAADMLRDAIEQEAAPGRELGGFATVQDRLDNTRLANAAIIAISVANMAGAIQFDTNWQRIGHTVPEDWLNVFTGQRSATFRHDNVMLVGTPIADQQHRQIGWLVQEVSTQRNAEQLAFGVLAIASSGVLAILSAVAVSSAGAYLLTRDLRRWSVDTCDAADRIAEPLGPGKAPPPQHADPTINAIGGMTESLGQAERALMRVSSGAAGRAQPDALSHVG